MMETITKEDPRRKVNDAARDGTRMDRTVVRLGVKAKRRHVSHSYRSTEFDMSSTEAALRPTLNGMQISMNFFDSILARSRNIRKTDADETGSFISSPRLNFSAEQKTKQRSFGEGSREHDDIVDITFELEGNGAFGQLHTSFPQEKFSGEAPVNEERNSTLQIPRDFELHPDLVTYISKMINDHLPSRRVGNLDETLSKKEEQMMGIMYTIYCLSEKPQHLRDLRAASIHIVSAISQFKRNKKLVSYGCLILERFLAEEGARKSHLKELREALIVAGVEQILIDLMNFHSTMAFMQTVCCKLLWALAPTEPGAPKPIDVDIIRFAIRAMGKFPNDNGVQYGACTLLQKLAIDSVNEERAGKEGAPKFVLDAAMSDVLDQEVVKKACAALWNLSFCDSNRGQMINNDAHYDIFKVIDKFSADPFNRSDIAADACGVIWNLADLPNRKSSLIDHMVPEKVVKTMQRFRFDEKVQEMGCGCLRSLAHDDKSRIGLMQIGAAEKILESMKDHVNSQGIQYQAFAVLKKLSCNDVNEGRLIKMQAGERILEAMDAHLKISSIQERACGVLWNLAVNDGHKVKLVQIGCAERMLKAMDTHERVEAVQYQTCRTLKRLARDSQNEVHLMRLGAAHHVLKAMELHIDSPNIQEKGCGVLWNLSERDEHKRQLMALGAAEQILKSMKRHVDKENVQYEACGALKRLAVDDQIEVELMKMKAASYVLAAMAKHVRIADVQGQACGVLWNLAFNGQAELMKLNAAEQILMAMETHPVNESVQEKACGTLWKLAEVEDNNDKLISLGVIQKVLDAMDHIKNHPGVQYQACGTLWNLAVKENNRKPLLLAKAEDRVLNAMKEHRDRPDILHSACGVLFNLAQTKIAIEKEVNIKSTANYTEPSPAAGSIPLGERGPSASPTKTTIISSRLLLARKGSVLSVVQCIRSHPANSDVIYQAMAALNFIAHDAKTLTSFLSNTSILKEVLKATKVFVDDNGIQENAASLLSKLMEAIALNAAAMSNLHPMEYPLKGDAISVGTPFLQAATDTMLTIARGHSFIPFFQQKTTKFFLSLYMYLAQKEVGLQHMLVERHSKKKSSFYRQESEDGFSDEGSSVFGRNRISFFEDNGANTRSSLALPVESMVISPAVLTRIVERSTSVLRSTRLEEKTQMAALILLKKILTDSANYPSSPFFMAARAAVHENQGVVACCATVFLMPTKSENLQLEVLSVIRILAQFGGRDSVAPLFERHFCNELLNRLLSYKTRTKLLVLSITTLQLLLNLKTAEEMSSLSIPDISCLLIELLTEASFAVASGLDKDVQTIRCIFSFLNSFNMQKTALYSSFISRGGLNSVIQILGLADSDGKRILMAQSALDLLLECWQNETTYDMILNSGKIFEISAAVSGVFGAALRRGFGLVLKSKMSSLKHLGAIRKQKSMKKSQKIMKIKSFKRSSRKHARDFIQDPPLCTKDTYAPVDSYVFHGIVSKACAWIETVVNHKDGEKMASVIVDSDTLMEQLRFAANLNHGHKIMEIKNLADQARETLSKVEDRSVRKLARSSDSGGFSL